jgi:hypothetical protein
MYDEMITTFNNRCNGITWKMNLRYIVNSIYLCYSIVLVTAVKDVVTLKLIG